MLCFHAWYKSTVSFEWNKEKEGELLLSIRKMLYRLQLTFPRNEGNGWKLQKLHEILHLPVDVTNFGSPKNFDTGIMENRLIHVGKKNAKLTQKRGPKIFTEQLGNRIYEQALFDKACRNMNIERSSLINKEDNFYDNNVESDIEIEENEQQDITLGSTYWIGNCFYHPHDRRGIWRLNKEKADYTISFKDEGYGYH